MNKTYNIHDLAAMKTQFTAWAHDNCPCDTLALDDDMSDYIHPSGHRCMCYGHEHYDNVHLATIDDEKIVIHYGDRMLTAMLNDAGETFITCGNTTWLGDDCDYYGDIIMFLADINNITFTD